MELTGTVTYTSSDTEVATVNAAGVVTAVSAGTATITGTAGGKSGTITITVEPATQIVAGKYTAGQEVIYNGTRFERLTEQNANYNEHFLYWKIMEIQ